VKARIETIALSTPEISFKACGNTQKYAQGRESSGKAFDFGPRAGPPDARAGTDHNLGLTVWRVAPLVFAMPGGYPREFLVSRTVGGYCGEILNSTSSHLPFAESVLDLVSHQQFGD
jgi:hypothetical protein